MINLSNIFCISIHSTTRVETNPASGFLIPSKFQSTPPRGWRRWNHTNQFNGRCISIHSTTRVETCRSLCSRCVSMDFNPLHHEGGDDRDKCTTHPSRPYFNPLHHEGGDLKVKSVFIVIQPISIHSTTRVETGGLSANLYQRTYFNPLHHEGGDQRPSLSSSRYLNFNPLHHEGGDSNTTQ